MIISTETITWLITGKKSVSPLKLLRFCEIKLTGLDKEKVENERKNIDNTINQKHKPTVRTLETFKWVTEILIREMSKKFGHQEIAEKQIQRIRDYSQPKILTPLEHLNKIESGYDDFFQFPDLKNLFVYHEIKQGFKVLRECLNIYSETESDNVVLDYLHNNEIFNTLNLKDSVTFDLSSFEVGGFNLNVTLYLIACIDIDINAQIEKHDKSFFSEIIKQMLLDIENDKFLKKTPFRYCTDAWKKETGIKFNKMSIILNIDERKFDRYNKSGKNIGSDIFKGIEFFIYQTTVFIKVLLSKTVLIMKQNQSREEIINIFKEYDTYYEIAKSRFTEYKNGVEVIYSTPST